MRRVEVVLGVVVRAGKVLICQRPDESHLGGHWEFPGGKREPDESMEQCLARELAEELGIVVTPLAALDVIEHDYPDVRVRLHPYLCTCGGGKPRPLASRQLRWVTPNELADYSFPPANDSLLRQLRERLGAAAKSETP